MSENENVEVASETVKIGPEGLGDEGLSFQEFEKIRKGEFVTKSVKKSEPVEKPLEQKQASESETEENEDELENDNADENDESESDKPKKKGGFQRRIDKLNAKTQKAQQEAEYWRSIAMGNKPVETEPKKEIVSADGKPDPENFDSHAEYVEALTDWKIEQKEKIAKANEQKEKFVAEHQKIVSNYTKGVKEFAEKHTDYDDVMDSVDDIIVPNELSVMIMKHSNGPALSYELAKNSESLKKLVDMPILDAAFLLGEISAKLPSKSTEEIKQEPKKITKAPKPIESVTKGGGSVAKSLDDPNLSFSDYERLRREQLKQRA